MTDGLTVLLSRKFGYVPLTLAVLALEVVFAWRVSLVYGEILHGQGADWEVNVLKGYHLSGGGGLRLRAGDAPALWGGGHSGAGQARRQVGSPGGVHGDGGHRPP